MRSERTSLPVVHERHGHMHPHSATPAEAAVSTAVGYSSCDAAAATDQAYIGVAAESWHDKQQQHAAEPHMGRVLEQDGKLRCCSCNSRIRMLLVAVTAAILVVGAGMAVGVYFGLTQGER